MRRNLLLSGLILSALLLMCPIGMAQKKAVRQKVQDEIDNYVVDSGTYSQVLDILFPRKVLTGDRGYALVLRYAPSFDTESQITIHSVDNKVEVVEYTPVNGSVYRQLKTILRRVGDFNAKGAAQRIQMRRRLLDVSPSLIKHLHESFYDRLRLLASYEPEITSDGTKTINVIEDGTQYLLWYRGGTRIQFEVIGSNINSQSPTNESPVIEWMKYVYRTIKESPAAGKR